MPTQFWPEIDDGTLTQVGAALLSQRWAVATPAGGWPRRIGLAEAELARRFQCAHALTLCNGSAALVLALQALGIGAGSRVLLPALTWVGCITAVLRVGAQPVLCDSEADRLTANMVDPVRERIDAIIAIPLYSQLVDLAAIRAAYPGCPIILDLSHVSCSASLGRPLRDADILASSLQASKALTCGEGGFAGTDDPVLAKRIEGLRTDGRIATGDPAGKDTVLAPHGMLHGANYALSEVAAGLLLGQLDRFDAQCWRRAAGGQLLIAELERLGVDHYADPDCVAGGVHYGIPVRVTEDPRHVLDAIEARLGLKLDRCYPPLPEGPLYRPESEPRYRDIAIESPPTPNARRWHETIVVVPHQLLLAAPDTLTSLAQCLAGRDPIDARTAPPPSVTVIMVSDGRRDTLGAALASVDAQHFAGAVRVLLILDRCDPADLDLGDCRHPVEQLRIDLDATLPAIARVARLRDMALRLCETELVCFLDDDNRWAPDHLETLHAAMRSHGVPAAHCWRRLVPQAGADWNGDSFPWLDHGSAAERAQFDLCRTLGIIEPGSRIVRDTASAGTPDADASMVDLGGWLLRTDLLRLFGISATPPGFDRPIDGVGEDDILLARLKAAAIPIACTEKVTLDYVLGGFSNDQARRSLGWAAA